MGVVDGAVVGAQEPPLGQRGDPMHGGQELDGIVAPSASCALAAPIMHIAELRQPLIGRPPGPAMLCPSWVCPVHPRACGERATQLAAKLDKNGSSPRLRGTENR